MAYNGKAYNNQVSSDASATSESFRNRFKGNSVWLRDQRSSKSDRNERRARAVWNGIRAGTITGPGADGAKRDLAKYFTKFEKELK